MKTLLLGTRTDRALFDPLIEAAQLAGHRVGWLEWGDEPRLPAALERDLEGSVFRVVAVSPGRVVAAKKVRGEPVLTDLVREYFSGCRLLLIRGGSSRDMPSIEADGSGWKVELSGGGFVRYTTDGLVKELSRPNLWAPKIHEP